MVPVNVRSRSIHCGVWPLLPNGWSELYLDITLTTICCMPASSGLLFPKQILARTSGSVELSLNERVSPDSLRQSLIRFSSTVALSIGTLFL